MAHKYLVNLTEEERGYLLDLMNKGKPAARAVARAHVLLRAGEGATDDEMAQARHLGASTGHRTRQRFVDEGLMPALSERPRPGQGPVLTGKQAAFLVALACSTPPAVDAATPGGSFGRTPASRGDFPRYGGSRA